jgi:hypothetical protein
MAEISCILDNYQEAGRYARKALALNSCAPVEVLDKYE